MSKAKRKTRSDKFPLTLYPAGQYCKKKIMEDCITLGLIKDMALEKYLNQATRLHGNQRVIQKKFNREMTLKPHVPCNLRTYPLIEAYAHWVPLMIGIAEKLGFMKVLAIKVCTKDGIGRKTRHIKPCSRANFQQSGFENAIS